MKRHALLIGYSGWDKSLKGVSLDLQNYKKFLMSPKGGGWYENEIKIIEDESIETIHATLLKRKLKDNDIEFTVFSGHGDYDDEEHYCRRLEVGKNETILEKDLIGFAKKQILILDSCSGLRSEETIAESRKIVKAQSVDSYKKQIEMARKMYEKKCLFCPEQKLRFYAAEVGSFAEDTIKGGRYSTALLTTLNNSVTEINIFRAHNIAADVVRMQSLEEQKPDYSVPKIQNFLPGSIIIDNKIYS